MASLRRHRRSPYWFVRYRDLDTGRWIEESTKLRADNPEESRKAHKIADAHSAREAKIAPVVGGEFVAWVPDYLAAHYDRASTLKRAEAAWLSLRDWMRERNIRHPREIRYEHAQDFMAWRKRSAKHNTARLEVKFLAFLLNEAMRREYCERNPIALAKISRETPPEKAELTDADFPKARAAFANEAPWMGIVFEILAHIGCRFAEASIPAERIDLDSDTVWIEDSKRKLSDPRKLYPVPIPSGLRPVLVAAKRRGRTVPPLVGEMNYRFNAVMKRAIGKTSHSLRVSFVTRCARAGLSEQEAMNLVNHSSRLVHRVYSRLNLADARRAMARVPQPPPP